LVQRTRQPSLLTRPTLQTIEAGIDENSHEPHVEGQLLAVLFDVQKHLDEGILHRFVCVGGIAKVVISNPQPSTLEQGHQGAESISCGLALAGEDEGLDLGCHRGRRRGDGICGPTGTPLINFDRAY
jgi:hypothetical protein